MTRTVVQIGNSEGIVLPKEVREETGLKKGVEFNLELTPDKKVVISKRDKKGRQKAPSSLTPEFFERLEKINKRYGPALKKLAKL